MKRSPPTLRNKLLRWLLVPLCFVLVADIVASTVAVHAIVQGIYDGELAAFRERNRMRSKARPFPDLKREDGRIELPF